jgi:hypothetical protein
MFSFKIDREKKVFIATVSGYFPKEEGIRYVSGFLEELKSIIPSNYVLIVESSNLLTTAYDAEDDLKACFQLYSDLKFKRIIFVMPKEFSVKSQALLIESKTSIVANHVTTLKSAYELIDMDD